MIIFHVSIFGLHWLVFPIMYRILNGLRYVASAIGELLHVQVRCACAEIVSYRVLIHLMNGNVRPSPIWVPLIDRTHPTISNVPIEVIYPSPCRFSLTALILLSLMFQLRLSIQLLVDSHWQLLIVRQSMTPCFMMLLSFSGAMEGCPETRVRVSRRDWITVEPMVKE